MIEHPYAARPRGLGMVMQPSIPSLGPCAATKRNILAVNKARHSPSGMDRPHPFRHQALHMPFRMKRKIQPPNRQHYPSTSKIDGAAPSREMHLGLRKTILKSG